MRRAPASDNDVVTVRVDEIPCANDRTHVLCNQGTYGGHDMRLPLFSAFAISIATTAFAGAQPEGVARLGPNPSVTGGTYTSPGGLSVAVDLRNFDGRTGVCGVWAESVSQSVMTKRRGKQVLARGNITIDGVSVLNSLG